MNDRALDAALYGVDLFGEPMSPPPSGPVAERFTLPPFTVLDASQGWWQDRKRRWISVGIKSEVGRDARAYHIKEWASNTEGVTSNQMDVSIFDPVLCELAYRWYCPPDGLVLDPFAGGSVRGIVAGMLGRRYHGIDLRPEQIHANRTQAATILRGDHGVRWEVGDSHDAVGMAPEADMVFSCPPYGDLEVYSDDPRDLSTMDPAAFRAQHAEIIRRTCTRLREDRFAVYVVGDYRQKDGALTGFVMDTIDAFRDAGLKYYNDGILVTARGTLAMRVTKQFDVSRKLGACHQRVLVFVKGDERRAARAIGSVVDFTG